MRLTRATASRAKATAVASWIDRLMAMIRRRSCRSAASPAGKVSTIIGRNCARPSMPTAKAASLTVPCCRATA